MSHFFETADRWAIRIILSEVNWRLAETSTRLPSKPKRDMIAYDDGDSANCSLRVCSSP